MAESLHFSVNTATLSIVINSVEKNKIRHFFIHASTV